MPNLTRTTSRPAPIRAAAPGPKTRILLVRQPVKSVRKSDEPDRAALKLAISVIAAVGALAAVWLLGYLGFRLGFAPLVRVPDLAIEDGGGLATGAMMLISLPQSILQAGMAQPMWLMAGFAVIAIPAAILGGIKPGTPPGGPRPKPAIVALSIMGAVIAMLNSAAVIYWVVSPFRNQLIAELPFNPTAAAGWLGDLQTAGGMDALATIAAALWVVVAMRLAIPLWLRALSASACLFALAIAAVGMAMSNATVAQLTANRSVCFLDEGTEGEDGGNVGNVRGGPQLLLGSTPQQIAALGVVEAARDPRQKVTVVELRNRPAVLTVIGRQTIAGFLAEHLSRKEE